MFEINQNKIKAMGVINITPNSFSDGGRYNTVDSFLAHFRELSQNCDIIDIGAESTAPFNQAISAQEELARFAEILFPALKKIELEKNKILSIDTYKPEVFTEVKNHIRSLGIKNKIYWNDVSGVIDDSVMSLEDSEYIYCHNRVKRRSDTSKHMDFACSENFISTFESEIEQAMNKLGKKNVLFDPCFGFAKTREQNHMLMQELPKIISKYRVPWVIGVSKKSFLRFPEGSSLNDPGVLRRAQDLELLFFQSLIFQNQNCEFIFRVHDPLALEALHLLPHQM